MQLRSKQRHGMLFGGLMLVAGSLLMGGCMEPDPKEEHKKERERWQESLRKQHEEHTLHTHLTEGRSELLAGNYQSAASHMAIVLRMQPESIEAHSYYAQALAKLGEYERAFLVIRQAFKLAPENPQLFMVVGDIYRDRQEWANAARAYLDAQDRAANVPALLPAIHFELGKVYLEQGDYESAIYRLDNVLKVQPELHEARLNKVIALHMLKRDPEAWQDLQYLEKVGIEVHPELKRAIQSRLSAYKKRR